MLKGIMVAVGMGLAGIAITLGGISILIISFFIPYILVSLLAMAGLVVMVLAPILMVRTLRAGGRVEEAQPVAVGVAALTPVAPVNDRGDSMGAMKPKLGYADAGVLLVVAVLVGAEAAAIAGGIGPIFAIVALGYTLVLGTVYWMYRWGRPKVALSAQQQAAYGAEARARAGSLVDGSILRGIDLFKDLDAGQLDRVARLGQRQYISSGQVLGVAGEFGHQIFAILDGKAQLFARSAIGEITVRVAGPGESFPLASLTGPGTLITTVEAMTDMDIVSIPRQRLLDLCHQDPVLGMRIYATIAEVLGSRYNRTLERLSSSAEAALKDAEFFANV